MDNRLKKVVFICGAGHSGSTLLGLILGSHSDCFYCGEAKNKVFIGNETKPIRKRTCKVCGADCPVWGSLAIDDSDGIYEQVAAKTEKPIIIDSTKDSVWIDTQLSKFKDNECKGFLIFLQRDGRAVINSWIRKDPDRDVTEQIVKWKKNIQDAKELFNIFEGNKIKVRYEELATKTEAVVKNICEILGIDYQPTMLKFYDGEHHPLGGNNGTQFLLAKAQKEKINSVFAGGDRSRIKSAKSNKLEYYENHELGITLDLRWKKELEPMVELLFEEMAGKENTEMKWEA